MKIKEARTWGDISIANGALTVAFEQFNQSLTFFEKLMHENSVVKGIAT